MTIEKTYTADQVKNMLDQSMKKFQSCMVDILRDCAKSPKYINLTAQDALNLAANKIEKLVK